MFHIRKRKETFVHIWTTYLFTPIHLVCKTWWLAWGGRINSFINLIYFSDSNIFVGQPRTQSDLQSVASDLDLHCLPAVRYKAVLLLFGIYHKKSFLCRRFRFALGAIIVFFFYGKNLIGKRCLGWSVCTLNYWTAHKSLVPYLSNTRKGL